MGKLRGFSAWARTSWPLWFGMGLFWSWLWMVLIKPSGAVFDFLPTAPLLSHRTVSLVGALVGAGILLGITAAHPSRPKTAGNLKKLRIGTVGVYAAITLVSFLPGYNPLVLQPIEALLTGFVIAQLFVGWGARSTAEATNIVWALSLSLAAAAGCAVFVFLLDFSKQDLLALLLPLGSAVLLEKTASPSPTTPTEDASVARPEKTTLRRLHGTVLIQGVAIGVWHFLFEIIVFEKCPAEFCIYRELNRIFTTHGLDDFIGFASMVGFIIALFLIFVTVRLLHLNFRGLVYQVGLPFMALGFIAITLNQGFIIENGTHMTGDVFVQGETLHTAGYFYALVIILILCRHISQSWEIDAWPLVSKVVLFLFVGQLAGYVGAFALNASGISGSDLCLVTVFVLLFGGLLLATSDSDWRDWGNATPAEGDRRHGAFRSACDKIAQAAQLTPRESEIFILLAKGRNLRFIENRLYISRDTVKTHLKRIYRKLDVHSQQELIDLVERSIQKMP